MIFGEAALRGPAPHSEFILASLPLALTVPEADIFHVWRWLLSIVVTVYVTIYTMRTLWLYLVWFRSSPRFTVMGHYALVLLLRARVRRFSGDLLRIGLLVVALSVVVGLHWVLL